MHDFLVWWFFICFIVSTVYDIYNADWKNDSMRIVFDLVLIVFYIFIFT